MRRFDANGDPLRVRHPGIHVPGRVPLGAELFRRGLSDGDASEDLSSRGIQFGPYCDKHPEIPLSLPFTRHCWKCEDRDGMVYCRRCPNTVKHPGDLCGKCQVEQAEAMNDLHR